MLVHRVGACQEPLEVVEADVEGYGEADGGPDRVTATNPALESKHVGRVDAKLGNLTLVGGQRNKVLRDGGFVAVDTRPGEEPFLCRVGIGASLGGSEGLRSDEEEGGLGIASTKGFFNVGAVDVGDEVEGQVAVAVGLESFRNHDGTAKKRSQQRKKERKEEAAILQIRSTDSNVHDAPDFLSCVALPVAGANLLGEFSHVVKNCIDTLDDAVSVDLHGLVADIAQSNVVDGAFLGEVDLLAGEHLMAQLLDASRLSEFDQQSQCFLGNQVLGKVKQDLAAILVGEAPRKLAEPLGVFGEELLEVEVLASGGVMVLEGMPCGQIGGLGEGHGLGY